MTWLRRILQVRDGTGTGSGPRGAACHAQHMLTSGHASQTRHCVCGVRGATLARVTAGSAGTMCYHRGRRTMLRVLEKNTAWAASSAPHARFRAAACHLAPHAYHWCSERRRTPVLLELGSVGSVVLSSVELPPHCWRISAHDLVYMRRNTPYGFKVNDIR